MKYVIILHTFWEDKIIGPFDEESQARAYAVNMSGWAFDDHGQWVWNIRPMEVPA